MKKYLYKSIALIIAIIPFGVAVGLGISGSRILEGEWVKTGVCVYSLGAWVCLLNFYTSFLRFPIHRLRGGSEEDYKFVSGIPLVGVLVLLGMALLPINTYITLASIALIVMDTGSVTWFVISIWGDDSMWGKNA